MVIFKTRTRECHGCSIFIVVTWRESPIGIACRPHELLPFHSTDAPSVVLWPSYILSSRIIVAIDVKASIDLYWNLMWQRFTEKYVKIYKSASEKRTVAHLPSQACIVFKRLNVLFRCFTLWSNVWAQISFFLSHKTVEKTTKLKHEA